MAANIDEEIGISQIDDDETNIINTRSHSTRSVGCRQRLLFLGKLFLKMGCLAYNLYLIWLVAYLKDNRYYWFLSVIPLFFNFLWPLCLFLEKRNMTLITFLFLDVYNDLERMTSSFAVVITLMSCFTILTRVAYYHRQPDQFIGPRFIIFSLQGSIILIVLDCFLQREGKLKEMLDFKDALTRMLLDFVDVFNMIEILSANECVGLGSFVSEGSSTEKAIQAFCTISFYVILFALDVESESGQSLRVKIEDSDSNEQKLPTQLLRMLYANCLFQNTAFFVTRIVVWAQNEFFNLGFMVKSQIPRLKLEDCDSNEQKLPSQLLKILYASCLSQNIAFLVIRIVVWAQYNFFNLGFMVKNVLVIFYFITYYFNVPEKRPQEDQQTQTE